MHSCSAHKARQFPVFSHIYFSSQCAGIRASTCSNSRVGAYQVSTLIGYGSPNKADTHDVHGAPLGKDETAATRQNLKWPYGEFEVPPEVYDLFSQGAKKGAEAEKEWNETWAKYQQKYPEVCNSGTLLLCTP